MSDSKPLAKCLSVPMSGEIDPRPSHKVSMLSKSPISSLSVSESDILCTESVPELSEPYPAKSSVQILYSPPPDLPPTVPTMYISTPVLEETDDLVPEHTHNLSESMKITSPVSKLGFSHIESVPKQYELSSAKSIDFPLVYSPPDSVPLSGDDDFHVTKSLSLVTADNFPIAGDKYKLETTVLSSPTIKAEYFSVPELKGFDHRVPDNTSSTKAKNMMFPMSSVDTLLGNGVPESLSSVPAKSIAHLLTSSPPESPPVYNLDSISFPAISLTENSDIIPFLTKNYDFEPPPDASLSTVLVSTTSPLSELFGDGPPAYGILY